jgi:hypothetical protein
MSQGENAGLWWKGWIKLEDFGSAVWDGSWRLGIVDIGLPHFVFYFSFHLDKKG